MNNWIEVGKYLNWGNKLNRFDHFFRLPPTLNATRTTSFNARRRWTKASDRKTSQSRRRRRRLSRMTIATFRSASLTASKIRAFKTAASDPRQRKLQRYFFKKWAIPGLFFLYLCLFKQTLQFLQQINVKKCPSSIQCWDLNQQTLEHESPPITTRPGPPPKNDDLKLFSSNSISNASVLGNGICRPLEKCSETKNGKLTLF